MKFINLSLISFAIFLLSLSCNGPAEPSVPSNVPSDIPSDIPSDTVVNPFLDTQGLLSASLLRTEKDFKWTNYDPMAPSNLSHLERVPFKYQDWVAVYRNDQGINYSYPTKEFVQGIKDQYSYLILLYPDDYKVEVSWEIYNDSYKTTVSKTIHLPEISTYGEDGEIHVFPISYAEDYSSISVDATKKVVVEGLASPDSIKWIGQNGLADQSVTPRYSRSSSYPYSPSYDSYFYYSYYDSYSYYSYSRSDYCSYYDSPHSCYPYYSFSYNSNRLAGSTDRAVPGNDNIVYLLK